MSIVTIKLPANATGVAYGRANFQPDGNRELALPDYVAKRIMTLPGVAGPTISGTTDALLAAADADWEGNYFLWAYGQTPEPDHAVEAATALFEANGDPIVSLS